MPSSSLLHRDEQAALRLRMCERRWLLLASLILGLGLDLTFQAKWSAMSDVETLIKAGDVVNLNAVPHLDALQPVFAIIYPDTADQRLAARYTAERIAALHAETAWPWPVRNVGALNTSAFAIPHSRVLTAGGPALRTAAGETAQPAVVPAGIEAGPSVPLLTSVDALRRVKAKLVVRSPKAYVGHFAGLAAVFMAVFWGLHLLWFRRGFAGDPYLLPLVFMLSGLGLLLMFSLPDPLRDLLRAQGFVAGVAASVGLVALASQVDVQRRLRPVQARVWLGLGLGLALLLLLFGTGPTGSDAKVNLVVPVLGSLQPVEGIKVCLVLFLATLFAQRWQSLRVLQQRAGLPRPVYRMVQLPRYRDAVPIVAGLGVVLLAFLILRDMGPALVIGCTFLGLYALVRGQWVGVSLGALALVGLFAWVYQTGAVPRVAGRVQMLLTPWSNFVIGGEHLAHAFWALATGGAWGQGLGLGHPRYIPAAHTDMVLPALGEELGFLGLAAVLLLYGALLIRLLRVAGRTNGIYSTLLVAGIAWLLTFQLGLIAGGALGLVPLSGVVAPWISYGKSSMMAHGLLLGLACSCSARRGSDEQQTLQHTHFRRGLRAASVVVVLLVSATIGKAAYVQLGQADDWSVRPALMMRADGARAYLYNPRLLDARAHLVRGTIYDRSGVPLASSQWEELEAHAATYATLGVDLDLLDPTRRRHYPFGPLTFYQLGDVNTRVKWGASNSLYAEHAYLSYLRGYDNEPTPVEVQRTPGGPSEPVVRYDYAALRPLLRHGPAHPQAQGLVDRDRSLHLTLDIRLQQRVAEVLAAQVDSGKTASALVVDAGTGEVLAAVTHPLPAVTERPTALHADPNVFDRTFGHGAKPPGSIFKLVTAMAALNQDSTLRTWSHPVRASDRYARRGEPVGSVDMNRALVQSSNVYFAALAHDQVMPDSLLHLLDAFGYRLGGPRLDLMAQAALLRAPDNLRQVGFGQGPLVGSPLQGVRVAAAIANDGQLMPIHWVRRPARAPGQRVTTPARARRLAQSMRNVVTMPRGTAWRLRDLPIPVAGKTGTAEEVEWVVQDGERVRQRRNHAWFTGFAPYHDTPLSGRRIAVTVLVEDGGMGGQAAAPVAGAIVEAAAALDLIVGPAPIDP
ncbi:MAG: FtsW/RodA/SpoVE family cell cycle protein [Bacteroidota bacterium]